MGNHRTPVRTRLPHSLANSMSKQYVGLTQWSEFAEDGIWLAIGPYDTKEEAEAHPLVDYAVEILPPSTTELPPHNRWDFAT